MKRLAVVITCVDTPLMLQESIEYAMENSTPELTDIISVDNGSRVPLEITGSNQHIRLDKNVGGNFIFHDLLELGTFYEYEFIAFIDTDIMLREKAWDAQLIAAFDADPKLGLVGFVGSDEIDAAGGRGGGTMSHMLGDKYRTGQGSAASVHGKTVVGVTPAAVLDHCVMIFRKSVLQEVPPARVISTPGHFYDRIVSCEVLNRGYHIAVLGVAFDHFSGGTGNGIENRNELYTNWLISQQVDPGLNPDLEVYKLGERKFLSRWRDQDNFIPLKVYPDYYIQHFFRR